MSRSTSNINTQTKQGFVRDAAQISASSGAPREHESAVLTSCQNKTPK